MQLLLDSPVAIASESFSLAFSICTGNVKKLLKTTSKKKKHNKSVMLARSILNRIERKVSKALKKKEISHEDFVAIINVERKLEK